MTVKALKTETLHARRVAYLNTRYPSLSHTFIEREVRALRELGCEVHTFSVRRTNPEGTLTKSHQAAARETFCLLDGPLSLAGIIAAGLLHPLAMMRAAFAAQRLAPPGLKSRVRHLCYALEAGKLALELRRRRVRHVHVHMANNGAAVALLATIFDRNLQYSLSIHGSAEFFHVDSWTLKEKVENAAFVRCISSFCRAQVMTWISPAAWSRCHIVRCGVDVDEFLACPPAANGPLKILTIGRMEAIKGYPVLLQACRKLSDRGIDWQLEMVGSGPLIPHLQALASDLGIASRITFAGAAGQETVQNHIAQSHVLVISSFMEGVPVVLMEAMAKQRAIVATTVGGIPELISHGVDGLLVTAGCTESLSAALERLDADRSLRIALGRAARRRVESEYNLSETARGMATLFDRYINGTTSAPNHGRPASTELALDGCRDVQPQA